MTKAAPTIQSSASSRMFYLDALRCFCMLFGILVHGASIGHTPLFEGIKMVSDHFRMATFFLISGFFTTMVAARMELTSYARSRRDILLYPFLATLILLNPVTNWLIYNFHNAPLGWREYFLADGWRLPKAGMGVWHLHLWFLVSLMLYALLTPWILRLARGPRVAALTDGYLRSTGRLMPFATALLLGLSAVVMQTIYSLLLEPLVGGTLFDWCTRASLNYLPYFVLGLIAYLNRRFFEALHCFSPIGLVLAGTLLYLSSGWRDSAPSALASTIFWVSRAAFITFVIMGLLSLFRRFMDKPGRALAFLVDSAYTFYLFHLLVIYAIANIASRYTDDLYLIFAIIVLLGTPLLLLLHGLLIRHVPMLRLMFNGKRVRQVARTPASA